MAMPHDNTGCGEEEKRREENENDYR